MYGKMKRRPTIEIEIEIDNSGTTAPVHPRLAEMNEKIKNELAYLEENGSGGDHSEESLDFLERVYCALQRCHDGHPIKIRHEKAVAAVLTKWRPDAVQNKEESR